MKITVYRESTGLLRLRYTIKPRRWYMKAKLLDSETTTNHTFDVEHESKTYHVQIYLNAKGKFIDDSITLNDVELEHEGDEGQIREDIIEYLDEHWDELVKAWFVKCLW